jgi:hypothetical protein
MRSRDYIAMSRSQRFTQSARLSASIFQSIPKMVALVGAPAGTGVSEGIKLALKALSKG